MNEQIDQLSMLAEKAGLHREWFIDCPEIENFAELIIQECANYVDELWVHQKQFKGTLDVGNALRQRFGVDK